MRDTLRVRLALFSLAFILPFVALLSIGITRKFEDDGAAGRERLRGQRVAVQRILLNYIESLRFKMTELENQDGFRDLASPELHARCALFLRLHPELINVAVLDREGTLRFSSAFPITSPPQNYRALENSAEIFSSTGFHITTAAKGTTTGRWACVAVQPLKANPDLFLAIPIDLQQLSKVLYLGPDSADFIVTVADRNRRLVLSSHDPVKTIGTPLPDGPLVRDELGAGRGTGAFTGLDGVARTYDAALLPIADWLVSATLPTEEIYVDARIKLLRGSVVIIVVCLLAVFAVRFAAAKLTQPVGALADTARQHADGRHETLATIEGPAEIADTARAFNDMVRARQRMEADLIVSEQRYRTVVEQTGQLIYDLELATGRILWFGERAIRDITGYTAEEFALIDNAAWGERLHPEDRTTTLALHANCLSDGTPFVTEYRFRHKDGTYRIIEDYGVVLRDATGRPERMLGRMSDATARHQIEHALRESEDRYRLVAEQTGQLIYDLDVKTGQARWFGVAAAQQILGTTPEAMSPLGIDGWRARLHPEDRAAAVARLEHCLRTGTPCQAEYRLRHNDGTYHLVDERGAVLLDRHGAVHRMVGRMIDITERTRVLREITTRQRLLRQIIDLVPHFIFAKDRAGRFLLANESLARAHNLSCEKMIGLTDADIHPDAAESEAYRADDLAVIDDKQSRFIAEEYHTDASGMRRVVSTFKIPFLFPGPEGDIPAVLGVAVDITELKLAQEQRQQIEKKLLETQKLESLGVLAGGIAHDFNNLLTGVLGNAGLARLSLPAGAPALESLANIERASRRAAELCTQMLAYSGKGRFVVQSLDLNELARESLELLSVSISKKAQLRFVPAAQLPPILADATQLRQIVMNLVINASEALEGRTGQITLATGVAKVDAAYLATTHVAGDLPAGDAVYLEVGDTGCGMTRETLARIFDPFFTTKFTGRGLGLAAVLGIVRGHKGAIKVYSEPGAGTTFRVLFPAASGATQPVVRPPAAPPLWRGSGHILVVDDEETVRTVITGILKVLGFTCDTAEDGAIALERYRADPERYAAVLLDLTMPNVDGEETFRQLRLLRPDVKVVLMSGFNRVDAINRFIGKGLAGFVQKPFQVETLSAELRRVLSR